MGVPQAGQSATPWDPIIGTPGHITSFTPVLGGWWKSKRGKKVGMQRENKQRDQASDANEKKLKNEMEKQEKLGESEEGMKRGREGERER